MERGGRKEKEKRKILFVAPDDSTKTFDRAYDNTAGARTSSVQ